MSERWILRSTKAGADPTTSGAMTLLAPETHDGRTLRLLTLLDEYTRECLAIRGFFWSTSTPSSTYNLC